MIFYDSGVIEKFNILKKRDVLINWETVFDVYFCTFFAVVQNFRVIKVLFVSKVFVIVKRIGQWEFFELNTVLKGSFVMVLMIGGIILLIGFSLMWVYEKVVVGCLILFKFFLDFGESFGAWINHIDFL